MKIQNENFLKWWQENKQNYSAALLDIDGTLLLGKAPLKGSAELIEHLESDKFPYILLTNDCIHNEQQKEDILRNAGIYVPASKIISCGQAINYLIDTMSLKGRKFFVMGRFGNPDYGEAGGLVVTRNLSEMNDCSGIIVGELNYEWEQTIVAVINKLKDNPETLFIIPNPDSYWRTGSGSNIYIGAGGIGRFIMKIVEEYGVTISPLYLGKPYRTIYEYTLKKLNEIKVIPEPEHKKIIVLGDSLKSDILGANNMGFSSALLLTGITTHSRIRNEAKIKPDYIFRSIL